MLEDKEPVEVIDSAPGAQPKLSLVVALSLMLGVLVSVSVAGGVVYVRERSAWQAQLRTAASEIAEKKRALDEMAQQVEALSRQMDVLKQHSIARSTGPRAQMTPPAAAAPPATPAAGASRPAPAVVAPPRKKAKPRPEGQDCELVGKSPEAQKATLQRCITAMEAPAARPRSR